MKNKGYFLVLSTAFISGFSIFINKFVVSVANPYVFTFLKNILVALLLTSVLLIFKEYRIFKSLNRRQWVILVAIGLIGGSVPFLLFFKGLAMTTAAGASFIQKTMFIWIFILASFFLKEKISPKYVAAGLALIIGNLLLLKFSDIRIDAGSGLVFIATLFWAIENVVSKHILKELPSKIVMWSRMFFGSVFILIFLAFTHQLVILKNLNIQQIGWSAIASVLLFGYVYTWYTGIKYVKISEAAIILMLGSPITTALSTIFIKPAAFQEYLAMFLVVGGVLTALGINKITDKFKQIYVRS
jgi:drug/metabolite transporter (DMT)-like permease